MARQADGSFRLFHVAGIDVFLHWSWLLVAFLQIQLTENRYENPIFGVIEYVSLFGIVLLHEFGHAFACRSVGGLANKIVLWPLGGVAVVSPPPRPGALLWSIAAGPLVNVVLVPVTLPMVFLSSSLSTDVQQFTMSLAAINLGLLLFNMLPIYPLDGGQILQALLWFPLGRSRSLMVASILGLIVGAGLIIPLLWAGSWWTALIAAFIAFRSWAGIQQARFLSHLETLPRHASLACPYCHAQPVQGEGYRCPECGALFDVFDWKGICPRCQARTGDVMCLSCFRPQPLGAWYPPADAPVAREQA
jgi:Zn-dependent protease